MCMFCSSADTRTHTHTCPHTHSHTHTHVHTHMHTHTLTLTHTHTCIHTHIKVSDCYSCVSDWKEVESWYSHAASLSDQYPHSHELSSAYNLHCDINHIRSDKLTVLYLTIVSIAVSLLSSLVPVMYIRSRKGWELAMRSIFKSLCS